MFTVLILAYFCLSVVWTSLLAETWKSKRNEVLFWWDLRASLRDEPMEVEERPEFEGGKAVFDITQEVEKVIKKESLPLASPASFEDGPCSY